MQINNVQDNITNVPMKKFVYLIDSLIFFIPPIFPYATALKEEDEEADEEPQLKEPVYAQVEALLFVFVLVEAIVPAVSVSLEATKLEIKLNILLSPFDFFVSYIYIKYIKSIEFQFLFISLQNLTKRIKIQLTCPKIKLNF